VARPPVPDTTAFIETIRHPTRLSAATHPGDVWLSGVVACELYAGTRSPGDRQAVDRLVRRARNADTILIPTLDEWLTAGTLLSRRTRLYGAARPKDHLADLLILLSAARIKGEVWTANIGHFEAWADLARRAGLDVTVASFP
jgi:predicted nucleic acid-binding protein